MNKINKFIIILLSFNSYSLSLSLGLSFKYQNISDDFKFEIKDDEVYKNERYKRNLYNINVGLFFDFYYLELGFDYSFGLSGDIYLDSIEKTTFLYKYKKSMFELDLKGKYPFNIGNMVAIAFGGGLNISITSSFKESNYDKFIDYERDLKSNFDLIFYVGASIDFKIKDFYLRFNSDFGINSLPDKTLVDDNFKGLSLMFRVGINFGIIYYNKKFKDKIKSDI